MDYSPLATATGKSVVVERIKPAKGGFLAKLRGVDDRTAAETLHGEELFVERERLPDPGEGEYYQSDLLGLSVYATGGQLIGKLESMVNYGAGDLMEVRATDRADTVLVPFKGAEVDIRSGSIHVAIPEGLLEV